MRGVVFGLALGLVVLAAPATGAAAEAPAAEPFAWDGAALDRMVRAVADHYRLAAAGGWPRVPDGPSLRPGMEDARVPAIRARLAASGDLAAADGAAAAAPVMDAALEAATRRFQARHGLVVDGVIGRRTVAAMNVTAVARAEQLALNYDRLRALARRLPATGVVINVAAAGLQLMEKGRVVLTSRVIVGRPDQPTPLLAAELREVEINPFWTVPARLLRQEVLPRIDADPGFLAAHRLRVLGGPDGQEETAPERVDWKNFLARGYRLRQDPGGNNPLGAVKFLFPNPYGIYLHDTPEKRLFGRAVRAFSHGCVRVNRAVDLAARLLAADPAWTGERLAAVIESRRTVRVRLPRPLPVHLVYLTAWAAADGTVQFRPDIYGRDHAGRREAVADRPQAEACGAGALSAAPVPTAEAG